MAASIIADYFPQVQILAEACQDLINLYQLAESPSYCSWYLQLGHLHRLQSIICHWEWG